MRKCSNRVLLVLYCIVIGLKLTGMLEWTWVSVLLAPILPALVYFAVCIWAGILAEAYNNMFGK